MQKEFFKDVPNYEGLYQVSNIGNVKSLPREIVNAKGKYISKEKILKPGKDGKGYYFVNLSKEGKMKSIKVHVLVAMAFFGHKTNGYKIVVDHINNNPSDNRLENLQLISQRENCSKDRKNKSSKYIGVYWHKKANKWMGRIQINKKNIYLGIFENEHEAHLAYQKALEEIKKPT
jgi:hypothetical protein